MNENWNSSGIELQFDFMMSEANNPANVMKQEWRNSVHQLIQFIARAKTANELLKINWIWTELITPFLIIITVHCKH